ncbi:E3 ubiquitin- ligase NEURL1B [Brachionus plicatilis]|uniref:E3 ubiquitin-ligase NEURL1B n=1 Tax=Brachionus plicatilis TaxID=10195 RepID=A0A3M7QPU6_BRAPC|nr:E3 ubiquitin- ligase NEURL1B [Brachionus plicatilis]
MGTNESKITDFRGENHSSNTQAAFLVETNYSDSETENEVKNSDEIDQNDYLYNLPKYVYPDLTNRRGYWAGAVPQNCVKEKDILYFFVNTKGEVHYGINNSYRGHFFDGVEVFTSSQEPKPLWAMFDIYGNTLAIEILNFSYKKNGSQKTDCNESTFESISSISNNFRTLNLDTSSASTSMDSSIDLVTIIPQNGVTMRQKKDNFSNMLISHRRLCVDNHLNETLSDSIVDNRQTRAVNELKRKIKNFYESIPVLIHEKLNASDTQYFKFLDKIHGKNVNICEPDCSIAYRESSFKQFDSPVASVDRKRPTQNAYAFFNKIVDIGEPFCIQIVGIDQHLGESQMSLGIGCTTCDPNGLEPVTDLPDDADCLLDRPEYWIVFQNLFNSDLVSKRHNVSLADELCFIINEKSGNLEFYINGNEITKCLFNVDITQRLWFFFNLCGRINAVRIIKPCEKWTQVKNNTKNQRPNSALIDYFESQLIPDFGNESDKNVLRIRKNSSHEKRKSGLDECKICLDAPIECVFYSCGHMCLCWNCANALKEKAVKDSNQNKTSKNPACPICRVEILDIIRFFKS